jgi:membrane protein implicated in regulation of membrane protease activity
VVEGTTFGISFITIGVVLLLLEISLPGFFMGVPALVLIVLGVLAFLAPSYALSPLWAPVIVLVVGVPATIVTFVTYRKIAPSNEPPVTTAADNLVGREATVTRALEPGSSKGKVRLGRQDWSATAAQPIPPGTLVRIARVEGITLVVERVESERA